MKMDYRWTGLIAVLACPWASAGWLDDARNTMSEARAAMQETQETVREARRTGNDLKGARAADGDNGAEAPRAAAPGTRESQGAE